MEKYKVFLYSGLISILLDLDHIIMLLREGLPITFYNLEENGTRLLHLPAFYILAGYAMYATIVFMLSIKKSNKKEKN